MREPEYEMSTARYDEVEHTDTPLAVVSRELEMTLGQVEKEWEMLAMRLTPFLGKEEPRADAPETRLVAMTRGSSPAVTELRHLVERLEEFTGRMRRVHGRLEL
jgi:hypothetical protein